VKILYLTAHYDDLEVCAGGTASRYGGTSIVLTPKPKHGTWEEADTAAAILGIQLYGSRTDDNMYLLERIEELAVDCDTIISVSPYDSHPEHQAAASVAQQLARKNNVNLWYMDHAIPGGYTNSPRPNHFINIVGHGARKREALRCYKNVLAAYGNKWIQTIKARDEYYGAIHGTTEAEGFIVSNNMQ